MSTFEYLGVLISVILGLAVSHLVSGLGSIIQLKKEIKTYDVHLFWTFNILLYVSSIWWGMFYWIDKTDWNYLYFLLIIIYSIILYLLADVLYPKKWEDFADFKAHFFNNRRSFFLLLFIAAIVDIPETLLKAYDGLRPVPDHYEYLQAIWLTISLLGFFSKNKKIHRVIAYTYPVWVLFYLAASLFEISGNN